MSVITLELREDHVKLIKQLRWSVRNSVISGIGHDGEDYVPPFGEDNLHEAIDLILNGKDDRDPFITDEPKEYSQEQKAYWDNLYRELPIALDIILFNGSFDLGLYKTKFHTRDWRKVTKSELKK